MKFIRRISNYLRKLTEYINTFYFDSKIKVIELIMCILLMISLSALQFSGLVPPNGRGFIGQLQTFPIFYLAFRFNFFGLAFSLTISFFDLTTITIKYFQGPDVGFLLGLSLRIVSLIVAIIIAILAFRQDVQKRRLHRLAITDELTDVYNQRQFHILLEDEIEKSKKSNSSLGLVMIDIDNFKMYNDIYGHEYGDTVLKGTSAILKLIVKTNGIVCRYGGDEFVVIFPNTTIETLELFAHNIRLKFEMLRESYFPNDFSEKVTLSIGISEYPNRSNNKGELISQADMALYHAKNLGKDKVHLYQDIILQIRKNISSDNQQLIGAFKGLLSTISAKDKYTHAHCERVSSYAVMIGEALEFSVKEISILQYAGLLHDIGKIELPKTLLNKQGCLTEEELSIIRQHPIYSENILEPLEGIDNLMDYVRHHHEKFDGSGYPDGLAGKEISLGARILCVVDSFDAMISERPYSKSMTTEEALKELEYNSGTQFDPEIVKTFVEIMRSAAA